MHLPLLPKKKTLYIYILVTYNSKLLPNNLKFSQLSHYFFFSLHIDLKFLKLSSILKTPQFQLQLFLFSHSLKFFFFSSPCLKIYIIASSSSFFLSLPLSRFFIFIFLNSISNKNYDIQDFFSCFIRFKLMPLFTIIEDIVYIFCCIKFIIKKNVPKQCLQVFECSFNCLIVLLNSSIDCTLN